jgi:hypothetical protein
MANTMLVIIFNDRLLEQEGMRCLILCQLEIEKIEMLAHSI